MAGGILNKYRYRPQSFFITNFPTRTLVFWLLQLPIHASMVAKQSIQSIRVRRARDRSGWTRCQTRLDLLIFVTVIFYKYFKKRICKWAAKLSIGETYKAIDVIEMAVQQSLDSAWVISSINYVSPAQGIFLLDRKGAYHSLKACRLCIAAMVVCQ